MDKRYIELLTKLTENQANGNTPEYLLFEDVQALEQDSLIIKEPTAPEYDANGELTGRYPYWVTAYGKDYLARATQSALSLDPPGIPVVPSEQPQPTEAANNEPVVIRGVGKLKKSVKNRTKRDPMYLEKLNPGEFVFVAGKTTRHLSTSVNKANKAIREKMGFTDKEHPLVSVTAKAGDEVIIGQRAPSDGAYIYRQM